ncbi:hypothetical protein [Sphingomicrobium flavum]|uniref:hypothetical protein n=1 Tax=Sphingomicrobium flavum TaxID=1229164 RepID=UPI0021AD88B0|nr:hypothetical protein [Sphingomicrobium flavum]
MNMPDMNMNRAVERARWLARLEDALEECDRLSQQLVDQPSTSAQAIHIRKQIAAARSRLEQVRRARPAAKPLSDPAPLHEELATWRGNRDG